MPGLTEAQMRQHMDKDKIGSLYFLYGDEKHTLKQAAKKLMKKSGTDNFPEFNFQEFTNDTAMEQIVDAAVALPLMSERKCVAVSDFNIDEKKTDEIQRFQDLIENVPDSTVLIFYYPTLLFDAKKSTKWKKWIKKISETGVAAEYNPRAASELERMMIRRAEKSGCTLSKRNAAVLVDYAGTDLKTLLMEIEKLTAFADGNEISFEMIDKMVTKSMETTVFILSAELIAGNYGKAMACMDELFYRREEPIMILGALSGTYVDMYRVRAALQSGEPYNAPREYGDYRGREFRLQKAERSVRRLSMKALRGTLELLLETDIKLKSSKANPRVIMDTLIAKLLFIAKEA